MNPTDHNLRSSDGPVTIEVCDQAWLLSDPLVSVYMLTYNHERFIGAAIEGVIAQRTDFPIELIIGEDCSTDRTGEIVRAYQKRYPKIIRILTSELNVGMHVNEDRCLAVCRGTYISCCEGDDYWHHAGKLKMQVDAFRSNPRFTLCHTEFDRKTRFRLQRRRHAVATCGGVASGDAYVSLLHKWTVITATAMYRADVLRAFQSSLFNEKSWPFGDYNKALFASTQGSVSYLPISTATWRKAAGSATNQTVAAYLSMRLCYLDCRERFMLAFPVSSEVERSVREFSYREILKRSFWAGRTDIFEECVRWLSYNGGKCGVHSIRLRRRILGSRTLMGATQMFRAVVRKLLLVRP